MARIKRIKFAEKIRRFSKISVAAALALVVSAAVLVHQNITTDKDGDSAHGQEPRIANYNVTHEPDDITDSEETDDVTTDAETEENI